MEETLITNGIRIRVISQYRIDHSAPSLQKFVHSYNVFIDNLTDRAVKLLRRKWVITDAYRKVRIVEGDGVIGEQPVILSGDTHSYRSWCPMNTDIGTMSGHYVMLDLESKAEFIVQIPEFRLLADFKNN